MRTIAHIIFIDTLISLIITTHRFGALLRFYVPEPMRCNYNSLIFNYMVAK